MKTKIAIFVLFWALFSSFVVHKYYVSVTQLEFSQKNNRIEITTRIFIDDFEKALDAKFKEKMNLATAQENPKALDFIKKYCGEKIRIFVNGKPLEVVFMGKEYEDDVVICYLKAANSEKIKSVEFYNSILTETFSEQQNLIHSTINNSKKSFMLTNRDRKASITF